MYDANALYLGLRFRDPTPLINNVNADASPDIGWQADGFQGRFWIGAQQFHLTAWYSSFSKKPVIHLHIGPAMAGSPEKVFKGDGFTLRDAGGVEMVFAPDSDQRGYTQELRLPWAVFDPAFKPEAGATIAFTGEYFWGGPSGIRWPHVMWADPVNPALNTRVVLYQNPNAWGKIEFLAAGHLPRVAGAEEEELPLQGPVTLRVPVPTDATHFSLVIDDANGRRVRNLAGNYPIRDYLVTGTNGQRFVAVPWDGRADGPWEPRRQLFLGEVVPAGRYTVRGLTHRGLGVIHAGSFFNPGNPPWNTADGSGAWVSDHSPATMVATAPPGATGKATVFLGSPVYECGAPLIGLNAAGQKVWQFTRLTAPFIAATTNYVFIASPQVLTRLNPDTSREAPFPSGKIDIALPAAATGLTAQGDKIVVTVAKTNLVFDALTGEPTSAPAPEQPRVAVAGNVVKVFQNGKVIQTIGEPGGREPGPWNPRRFGDISAAVVQELPEGARVWVVETGPVRRVSVWSMNGQLVREYVGNTGYQGWDGMLSDTEPNVGYALGALLDVKLPGYEYQVKNVIGEGRPKPAAGKPAMFYFGLNPPFRVPQHFVSAVSGKPVEYLTDNGHLVSMVFMRRGERWQCVAALGPAAVKDQLGWPANFPQPPSANAVFSWSDLNRDGYQTPDEIVWHDPGRPYVLGQIYQWGYRSDQNLVYYSGGLAFRPVKFLADGAPVYDVSKAEALPGELGNAPGNIYRTARGYVTLQAQPELAQHLGVIHGQQALAGYDDSGRAWWTYPNFWLNVHGGASAPMALPGVLMGFLKFNGFPKMDAGWGVIGIHGNMGQVFLLRDDGVYLGELFTDQRMAPGSLPETKDCLGVPINDVSMGGEAFSGSLARQRDGKVRVTYGYTDVRVAEVVGLDTVQEIAPQAVELTAEQVAACRAFQPKTGAVAEKKELTIPRGGAFPLDPQVVAGNDALVIRRGREEVARVALRYDDQNLYAAWRVEDTTPWQNAGSAGPLLFKSGDSVNLFIGDNGGTRVLLGPVAMVYRPQGPGEQPVVFKSPVRETKFQYVATEPAITFHAQVAGTKTEYLVVATIPWTTLGITPKPGLTVRGDVGVLFSDQTGTATAERRQWADPETNVVNDIPSEAEFHPARWGMWRLE
jgi:hypothetical protein